MEEVMGTLSWKASDLQGAGERSQGWALVGEGVFLAVFLCVARPWLSLIHI